MKEINISHTLMNKRKEKGITQDALASYMGVSKASVSKWETGQSYPDITFLPPLAAYFNISIDELMNYSPQMIAVDIRDLYCRLAKDFSTKEFHGVYAECLDIIKKYYSCFLLLQQMSALLTNHYMFAPEKDLQEQIIQKIIELCDRIKSESGDPHLSNLANAIHATCLLMQNRPAEVIDLLGEDNIPLFQPNSLLANAYMSLGDLDRAEELLQSDLYQNLLNMINTALTLTSVKMSSPDSDSQKKAEELIQRMSAIIETFHMEYLHENTVLVFCLTAAQFYAIKGETDIALTYLEKYSDVCCSIIYPITLHGDDFFNRIDAWLNQLALGSPSPRNEKLVRESLLKAVTDNPAFSGLANHPKMKNIIRRLS